MGKLIIFDEHNGNILRKPSGTIAIKGDISTIQRKIYNVLLFVARKEVQKKPNPVEGRIFTISLDEVKRMAGLQSRNNSFYKTEIKGLMKKIVEYNILKKDKYVEGAFPLLSWVEFKAYSESRITVEFELPTIVIRSMLKNGAYANIDLIVVKGLKSKYSIILYELAKDYINREIPLVTIEQLKELFGIGINEYTVFPNFKKRVLEKAVKELNDNPNVGFNVRYELIKDVSGRKYKYIKFTVTKKKSAFRHIESLSLDDDNKLKKIIEMLPISLQVHEDIIYFLRKAVKEKGEDYVKAQIKFLLKQNNVINFAGYLKRAIQKDYAVFNGKIPEDIHGKYLDSKGETYQVYQVENSILAIREKDGKKFNVPLDIFKVWTKIEDEEENLI